MLLPLPPAAHRGRGPRLVHAVLARGHDAVDASTHVTSAGHRAHVDAVVGQADGGGGAGLGGGWSPQSAVGPELVLDQDVGLSAAA